jgi:hypothetical protein
MASFTRVTLLLDLRRRSRSTLSAHSPRRAIDDIDPSSLHSCAVEVDTGGSLRLAPPEGSSESSIDDDTGAAPDVPLTDEDRLRHELDAGRRRFTWAALIAIALTAVPFIWILWSDWGPVNPLRQTDYEDNFYDLQARSMFHGHLSIASGSIGIEGFVHDGRTYTYFGLFPSIIRMPILLLTSSLDGKLTPSSMLVAWLLTGLFASLLLWRVRFLIRGDAAMGRGEATGFGILLATLMGGTIWMLLASTPYVFNEDIAWSICLTVGSIFALLGVIERPSWGRVIASGALILCANLDRATTGWACAVGAGLIALWFLLGFAGQENRRWFLPVLAAGLIPLVVGCVVNYGKFGVWFGVSNTEQVWTHVNAYRRKFLAANHGAEEGTVFVPTNVVTYFRPDGLSLSQTFPFFTLPTSPPTALGGVLFDRLYRTSSLPASTPLLFVLSIWGLVTAFRPKPIGQAAKTRLLLLAAGSAGAALMLWGYIAPRYIGDFVPFLVLASAVAMVDILRRTEMARRSVRIGTIAVIAVAALFCIAANIGQAITPNEEWNSTQALSFVQAQKSIGDLTGHSLDDQVVRAEGLPTWGPAGQLYVIGACNALYVSNGENYSTVPSEQYERATWMTVQLGSQFQHNFDLTVGGPDTGKTTTVPLETVGGATVKVNATRTYHDQVVVTIAVDGGAKPAEGSPFDVMSGTTHSVVVTTDPVKHQFQVTVDGTIRAVSALPRQVPIHVQATNASAPSARFALVRPLPTPAPTLCESLIH